ncbi:hypothetical protein [Ectobacillus polymachus]|uniref:hypothetical protein n=1 Tax=Ectobacillus polymachus TaxID=1508806 RepID=UPI003A84FDD8
MKKFPLSLLIMFVFFLFMQQHVFAEETNLIQFKDTIIQDYQKMEGILVVGHNVTVEGTVKTAVIVINGDLHIKQTATITGPILVIGGQVEQDPGAKIGEHLIALQFNDATQNSFLFAGGLILGIWIIRIMIVIGMGIFTILTGVLMKQRIDRIGTLIQYGWGRLLVTGAFVSLALVALSILLTISIIGIPIAIVLLFMSFLSLFIGMATISSIVGQKIKGLEASPQWKIIMIGCMILIACMSIPLLGGFVTLLTLWLSFGISIKWMAEVRKK